MMWAILLLAYFVAASKQKATKHADLATQAAILVKLRAIAQLSLEGRFAYLIASGESYLELATVKNPRALDFYSFYRGLDFVIDNQNQLQTKKGTPFYRSQIDWLIRLVYRIAKHENTYNFNGFKKTKELDMKLICRELDNLPHLIDGESPLTRLLQENESRKKYLTVNDMPEYDRNIQDFKSLSESCDHDICNWLKARLQRSHDYRSYIFPDGADPVEVIEQGFSYSKKLKYNQMQVLEMYLYVLLARLNNQFGEKGEEVNPKISPLIAVTVTKLAKMYKDKNNLESKKNRIVLGVLINALKMFGIQVDNVNFDKKETKFISESNDELHIVGYSGKVQSTQLEKIVLLLLGWFNNEDQKKGTIRDLTSLVYEPVWDRLCPDVVAARHVNYYSV
jgi:hypothetical protein